MVKAREGDFIYWKNIPDGETLERIKEAGENGDCQRSYANRRDCDGVLYYHVSRGKNDFAWISACSSHTRIERRITPDELFSRCPQCRGQGIVGGNLGIIGTGNCPLCKGTGKDPSLSFPKPRQADKPGQRWEVKHKLELAGYTFDAPLTEAPKPGERVYTIDLYGGGLAITWAESQQEVEALKNGLLHWSWRSSIDHGKALAEINRKLLNGE